MIGINPFPKKHTQPKLIIVLNRLVIGGPAADTISLAHYLQHDFKILILYGEKESDEIQTNFILKEYPNLQLKKLKYLRRTINPLVDILAFFSLLKNIFFFRPAILHTHGSKSGLLGRSAAKVLSVPIIIHTFHGHLFHSYFNSITSKVVIITERFLANIFTCIIALSPQQRNDLIKYKITNLNKIHQLPLGVDEKIFLSDIEQYKNQFRTKYKLNANDVAIGIVGRIVPIKNHLLFINIAELILQTGIKNVYFFIVGDGQLKHEIQEYLKSKNLEFSEELNENNSKFIFTSWVENMATVYHGLDILALTSLNEGTPLTIIESQMCGKPVVAVNTGGVKDTFAPNESGFLIDDYDTNKFVESLIKLITNSTIRNEMGKQATKFAQSHYNKKAEVDAIKNLYQQQLIQKK